MLLKIAAMILVLLVTFFQSTTGMYSAMIMFLLCVACAGLAFGAFDALHNAFLAEYIPEYGHAVALLAVFGISLIVMRLVIDHFIKQNMQFPGIVDRLGAVVFGFCSAMILVGMLTIGIQLMPFGRDIMGFTRLVAVNDQGGETIEGSPIRGRAPDSYRYKSAGLWLGPGPDTFTVKIISRLSEFSFSGKVPFGEMHPEFLDEVQMVRFGPQMEAKQTAPGGMLHIQAVWRLEDDQLANGDVTRRPANAQWLCVRTKMDNPDEAKDSDGMQRFTPMQMRLVCRMSEAKNAPTQQFVPIGAALTVMQNTAFGDHRRLHAEQPMMVQGGGHVYDFVYEVPQDCIPLFLAYKRGERAEIPKSVLAAGPPKAEIVEAVTDVPDEPPVAAAAASEDRVPGRHVHSGRGEVDRALPVALEPDWLTGVELDLGGNRFRQGHGVANWPDFEAEPSLAIKRFHVPTGMKLFQLSITRQEAQSILGRAMQFARTTLAQYTIRDDKGDVHFRIGEIRIADVGGEEKLEIQYWPQAEMPERCIREPRVIQDASLTENSTLIYLFLLPEDRTAVEFDIGNRRRKLQ